VIHVPRGTAREDALHRRCGAYGAGRFILLLGPLFLAALGIGGAGAVAVLGHYRPYLLAGAAVLLGAGFYFTYRRPQLATDDTCERPQANRAGRIGLWIAT
jgi:hypothetical protein